MNVAIDGPDGARPILRGSIHRHHGARVVFSSKAPRREPATVRRPAQVAQMLALAHHIQRAIDQGLVADRAAVARELGFSRARITQLLNLLTLAPDLQLAVLEMEAVDGLEPIRERTLRTVVRESWWPEQRARWRTLTSKTVTRVGMREPVEPQRLHRLPDGYWSSVRSGNQQKRCVS